MKKDVLNIDIVSFLSYGYIYIPIVLFLIFWIKSTVAVIVLLFLAAAFCFCLLEKRFAKSRAPASDLYLDLYIYAVVLAIIIVWCVISGLGGYTKQAGDWSKHNVMLKTLTENDWPVSAEWQGKTGVICYYIAYYLVPALAGKLAGMEAVQQMTLVWSVIGIFLCVYNVCRQLREGAYWKYTPLAVCFGIILFATFQVPMTGIYHSWNPQDAADGVHWMSQSVRIQYTSNINSLRWVYPQFIPGILTASLLLGNRKRYDMWGLLCVPVILYSTFCFAGFALILAAAFMADLWKEGRCFSWKLLYDRKNICLLPLLAVLLIYIGANVLQEKPDGVQMKFTLIHYSSNKMLFILFQASWILWILLLARRKKNFYGNWLLPSCVCLFFIPFVMFGYWNDFCMRGSIPALCFLCFSVIGEFTGSVQERGGGMACGTDCRMSCDIRMGSFMQFIS